jgi:hypothetical protein
LKGPLGPEVFLRVVIAFSASVGAVAAVRAYLAITKQISELKAATIAHEEERLKPPLHPTVEMLEQGRREQVSDVHDGVPRKQSSLSDISTASRRVRRPSPCASCSRTRTHRSSGPDVWSSGTDRLPVLSNPCFRQHAGGVGRDNHACAAGLECTNRATEVLLAAITFRVIRAERTTRSGTLSNCRSENPLIAAAARAHGLEARGSGAHRRLSSAYAARTSRTGLRQPERPRQTSACSAVSALIVVTGPAEAGHSITKGG